MTQPPPALRYYSLLVKVPAAVGQCFTYASNIAVEIGDRVEIELGKRREVGFVVAEAEPLEGAKLIRNRLDPLPVLTPAMLELTRWLARRCFVTWYRAVETALPATLKRRGRGKARERRVLVPGVAPAAAEERFRADERLLSAFRMVVEHPETLTVPDLARRFDLTRGRIETLLKRGELKTVSVAERRDPLARTRQLPSATRPLPLTDEQRAALDAVLAGPGELLLAGVTGSGKTEVYLQAIARLLEEGKGAIVLVPEISLTPQTVDRFRSRFGETVAILHSQLSAGERYDEWLRARRGEARVVVGARSAVFAPVANLGLIVIDEAHETSYKQSDTPRYHALDVARERARREGARLVLGTATPTAEIAQAAPRTARLTRRIAARPMPTVEVVDMRLELVEGNRSIFSTALRRSLEETLERKEQALLFLNRRGHASFILCRGCGEAIHCPSCAVTLTLHEAAARTVGTGLLICHFCNHRAPVPAQCPKCGSRAIRSFGAGTERIEAETRKEFPAARVVRMDADTTVRKGAHRDILAAFAAGEHDVLVGTQMIGKGLDLPRVTLVGVVAADSSLHLPDFRAAERTFGILVQVVGRAGRASQPGRAVIQTYAPAHYAVRLAAEQDVSGFLEIELKRRRAASLPPFTRIVQWTVAGARQAEVRIAAESLRRAIEGPVGSLQGPAPAPIERLRGLYRWQIRWIIPADTAAETIEEAAKRAQTVKSKDLRVVVDVDPFDLL